MGLYQKSCINCEVDPSLQAGSSVTCKQIQNIAIVFRTLITTNTAEYSLTMPSERGSTCITFFLLTPINQIVGKVNPTKMVVCLWAKKCIMGIQNKIQVPCILMFKIQTFESKNKVIGNEIKLEIIIEYDKVPMHDLRLPPIISICYGVYKHHLFF